nr:MAG TPA: hypothetical protein [Caudoviricetes sp.]
MHPYKFRQGVHAHLVRFFFRGGGGVVFHTGRDPFPESVQAGVPQEFQHRHAGQADGPDFQSLHFRLGQIPGKNGLRICDFSHDNLFIINGYLQGRHVRDGLLHIFPFHVVVHFSAFHGSLSFFQAKAFQRQFSFFQAAGAAFQDVQEFFHLFPYNLTRPLLILDQIPVAERHNRIKHVKDPPMPHSRFILVIVPCTNTIPAPDGILVLAYQTDLMARGANTGSDPYVFRDPLPHGHFPGGFQGIVQDVRPHGITHAAGPVHVISEFHSHLTHRGGAESIHHPAPIPDNRVTIQFDDTDGVKFARGNSFTDNFPLHARPPVQVPQAGEVGLLIKITDRGIRQGVKSIIKDGHTQAGPRCARQFQGPEALTQGAGITPIGEDANGKNAFTVKIRRLNGRDLGHILISPPSLLAIAMAENQFPTTDQLPRICSH